MSVPNALHHAMRSAKEKAQEVAQEKAEKVKDAARRAKDLALQARDAAREGLRESDPRFLKSRIPAGKHCAFFVDRGRLLFEVDGEAIQQAREAPGNFANTVADALVAFGVNHPILTVILLSIPEAVIKAAAKNWKYIGPQLRGLAATMVASPAVKAAGIIILIEITIIIIRCVEIHLKDKNSVNGGVVIELLLPNFQVLSVIHPRGGYKAA
jgi:hypothetical protein